MDKFFALIKQLKFLLIALGIFWAFVIPYTAYNSNVMERENEQRAKEAKEQWANRKEQEAAVKIIKDAAKAEQLKKIQEQDIGLRCTNFWGRGKEFLGPIYLILNKEKRLKNNFRGTLTTFWQESYESSDETIYKTEEESLSKEPEEYQANFGLINIFNRSTYVAIYLNRTSLDVKFILNGYGDYDGECEEVSAKGIRETIKNHNDSTINNNIL